MSRRTSRRTYLRRVGAAAAASGGLLSAAVAAADCEATVYTNATEGGQSKLEVPAAEATVTGESTCDPGTELTIQLQDTDEDAIFVKSYVATVADGGGFAGTFDFSSQSPGTTFELSLVHEDGTTLDSLSNCEIVSDAPTPHPTPSPTPTPTPSPSSSPTPTATPSPTPTATPSPTPTATAPPTAGATATDGSGTDGAETREADGGADATDEGATATATTVDDGATGSPTPVSGPGFGLLAGVAGLAAAAWRLRDDT